MKGTRDGKHTCKHTIIRSRHADTGDRTPDAWVALLRRRQASAIGTRDGKHTHKGKVNTCGTAGMQAYTGELRTPGLHCCKVGL